MHSSTPVTLQVRVDPLVDQIDRLEQLAEALQGQEVRLQRDQDLLGGRQRVERQQAQRRRAVDQAEIELVLARLHGLAQDDLPADDVDQLGLGADEIDVGRQEPEIRPHEHQAGAEVRRLGQHLVGARLDASAARRRDGSSGGPGDRDRSRPPCCPAAARAAAMLTDRGRLADPPFLIQDRNRSQSVYLAATRNRSPQIARHRDHRDMTGQRLHLPTTSYYSVLSAVSVVIIAAN